MKINRYMYICSECSHEYLEQRRESESQYIIQCPKCDGEFKLNDTIFLEDEVIQPVVVDEAITE